MSQISIAPHSYLYLILITIKIKVAEKDKSVLKLNHVKYYNVGISKVEDFFTL